MGKSPGKWIKTVLFGKKSSKSNVPERKRGMPTSPYIYANDLIEALKKKHASGTYKSMKRVAGEPTALESIPVLLKNTKPVWVTCIVLPGWRAAHGFWSLQHLNGSAPGYRALSEVPVSKLCESIPAENLLKFHLRPYAQLGLDRSGVPTTNSSSEIIEELLSEIPKIVDAAQQVNQFCHTTALLNNNVTEEPWLPNVIYHSF
ncbi:hypothetical protein RHMOL_Rhmol03G0003700 [Rhododendron molle]|uniref:Uncharacterized protein n=1 Tax=Rhododendron molle TaxID=49168 RepID=A0ACC0P9Z7_RHOML|nr:hypothetical protein RHMOL_Rhmol03G0003700 [Rhododendron molle]